MDGARFDHLTRRLAQPLPRRRLLARGAAAGLARALLAGRAMLRRQRLLPGRASLLRRDVLPRQSVLFPRPLLPVQHRSVRGHVLREG